MLQRTLMVAAIAAGLLIVTGHRPATGQERSPQQKQTQTQEQEQIFGSDLMSPDERAEYRSRMRAAPTEEQRERIRREHHAQMQERARERGMTLPGEPPDRDMRRGMGPGGGGGMGPGGGMGGGRR